MCGSLLALGAMARPVAASDAASDEARLRARLAPEVARKVLAIVRAARAGGSLVIPLVVLCDLVARGVPADAASVAVLIAARAGATDQTLLRIRERIHARIDGGGAPAGTAGEVIRQWLRETPGKSRRSGEPPAGRSRLP